MNTPIMPENKSDAPSADHCHGNESADAEVKSCCHSSPSAPVEKLPEHGCCGGGGHEHHHHDEAVKPSAASKYFCPMCPGVESDVPGVCPKCGMALERNPLFRAPKKTIYTCPMHPEVRQDHPGTCPKCGMALEPETVSADEEENGELRDMSRRFWIGAALTLPVFLIAMTH